MNFTVAEEETQFKPVSINLTLTSLEELAWLTARLSTNDNTIREASVGDSYEEIISNTEDPFWGLWEALDTRFKEYVK